MVIKLLLQLPSPLFMSHIYVVGERLGGGGGGCFTGLKLMEMPQYTHWLHIMLYDALYMYMTK